MWKRKFVFVAVASKSVLSILSTKFEERVSISLSFRSWIGDFAADGSIKGLHSLFHFCIYVCVCVY